MAGLGIDAATWTALSRLLDEALDLPEDERTRWLDTLAPEYAPLRPRLAELLSRLPADGRALPLSTLPRLAPALPAAQAATGAPGDTVGPYRLVRRLAEGGMGTVWIAERTDGLIDRPVALKLPRGTWERPELAARMARERRILAALNHPNIARLYDAGITAEGLPFLALEYVEGVRIDAFARDRALSVPARIQLFLQVARAVAHAHSRLVVHRDLKPSNILVTAEGEVRLLDFGVAGLLEDGNARPSDLTQAAGPALTPSHASPEQLQGSPIGVASDVYALGVVLCELLTGRLPYRLARESRGALEDAILRGEPARPSTLADTPAVARALRGDLDTITLKALKKHPDERYPSVLALADDLERHLQGFAVRARPDSRAYRLAKFVRRHRVAVFAVAAVAGALVTGTALALWQARVARVEQHRAEEVKEFIASIFEDADPYGGAGKVPDAAELLRRARKRIDRDLAGRPDLRFELLNIVGWSLYNLQDQDSAEEIATVVRSEGSAVLPANHAQVLRARLLQVEIDRLRGETGGMRAEIEALLPLLRTTPGVTAHDVLSAEAALAHLGILEGRYAEAEAAARAAIVTATATFGPDHPDTVALLRLVAIALNFQDRSAEALELSREVLRRSLAQAGGDERSPRVIESHASLGRSLGGVGDIAGARDHYGRAVRGAQETFGPTSMMAGFFAANLATYDLEAGFIASAIEHADLALQAEGDQAGDSHHRSSVLLTRGRALLAARRFAEAERDLTASWEIRTRNHGRDHPRTVAALGDRAIALAWTGRGGEAATLIEAVLPSATQARARAGLLHGLAVIRRLEAGPSAALALLAEAAPLVENQPRARECLLDVLVETGLAHLDLGQSAAAATVLQRALELSEGFRLAPTPQRAEILVGLGRARLGLGHAADALGPLEEADSIWRAFDASARGAADAAAWLAQGYEAVGRTAEAAGVRARATGVRASPVGTEP